ncbi:hypothetical protein HL658_03520 [Azospirillum sp. RWY-5-1]|uniref:NERD domain-containing protein n=1 Tax=Azospirillum oleiclasticum TaxID=2735135 RepID=A0ABX2T383_9PROT|nr:hypothetical protein [Azospirillum oleiclasticum]NYZ11606.1 hypothetical protein [Azospirillum oleiclasticum]NYZ18767.1 hypothetical protein [Azospirillum oleiclasticum]
MEFITTNEASNGRPVHAGTASAATDIQEIMRRLATSRPVFHSEADFQHAFAWTVRELHPAAGVRLEYKPAIAGPRPEIDIWLRLGERIVAVELKYLTSKLEAVMDGETFRLANQNALPIRRYDCVADIERLERVVEAFGGQSLIEGYAVVLTNTRSCWLGGSDAGTIDAAFRLPEGRRLSGSLAWGERAAAGTRRNREHAVVLKGSYVAAWRDYSVVPGTNGTFRYLLNSVTGDAWGARRQ